MTNYSNTGLQGTFWCEDTPPPPPPTLIREDCLRKLAYLPYFEEPEMKGHLPYRDTVFWIFRCLLKTRGILPIVTCQVCSVFRPLFEVESIFLRLNQSFEVESIFLTPFFTATQSFCPPFLKILTPLLWYFCLFNPLLS